MLVRPVAAGALFLWLWAEPSGLTAPQPAASSDVTAQEIGQAMRLGRSSDTERARFHALYQIPVTEPFIESLDVITEYRRLVLIAEERFAAGNWAFTTDARAGAEALRPWRQQLAIRMRVRFRPTDLYTKGLPAVSIIIGPSTAQVLPLSMTTDPQYALRSSPKEQFTPIAGMIVEAAFDAAAVGRRAQPMLVSGPGTLELRRTVDFARMR